MLEAISSILAIVHEPNYCETCCELETTSQRGMSSVRDALPFRLEPRDQKIIHANPPFMLAKLKPGVFAVVVTMVDGLGNPYDSIPFSVVQPDPPTPIVQTPPV